MALDTSFNRIVATTLPLIAPRVTESIVGGISLLWKLGILGGVETRGGAPQIVEPVFLTANSTVRGYGEFETLDTTVQDQPNAASYLWKIVAGSESLSLLEQGKNANDETRVVDLWAAIIDRLAESMRIETNRQLFLDGTGDGGNDFTGLAVGIDFAGSNSTYGNINSATFANWRNQTDSSSTNNVLLSANFGEIPIAITNLANRCASQNEWPNLYVTSREVYTSYERTLTQNEKFERMLSDEDMARSGFQNLTFKGGAVVFDEQIFPNTLSAAPSATAGHGFLALNCRYIKFVMMDNFDFVMSDPIRPFNQMAETIQMIVHGNLVMTRRRSQGRINFRTA